MQLQVSIMENVDPHFKEGTEAMKEIWEHLGLRDGGCLRPCPVLRAGLLESAAPPAHPLEGPQT